MPHSLLRRHRSGPVAQVSGYVAIAASLDPESIRDEYVDLVASAPTRTQRYIDDHDISGRSSESQRAEELLAHRVFLERTALLIPDWPPTRIVDFQTPLNSKRADGYGEVDLLAVGDGLSVIELKVLRPDGTADTPLNALLEAVGYCAVVEANEARIIEELRDIGYPVDSGPLSALVLAPADYWARWDRTRTKQPWRKALRAAGDSVRKATEVTVRFGSFDADDVGPALAVSDPLT